MSEESTSLPPVGPAPLPVVDPATTLVVEPAAPIETITLADIMGSREVLIKKEAEDRAILESIGTIGSDTLRGQLIQWASIGFPNAYSIKSISITPPQVCSDGMTRSLADYIQYCSTRTIQEHIAVLQARLPDIFVSFSFTGISISIVLLKQ